MKEEIKSNIFALLKEDIKEVVNKELKEVERLNSTVALLQTHVNNLKTENMQLQERCSKSESQIDELEQYGRRLCLRIPGISTDEKETSDSVLTIVKEIIDERSINIPDSTIDHARRIGKKKGKSQAVTVSFTTHRHNSLFHKAMKKIRVGKNSHRFDHETIQSLEKSSKLCISSGR